MYAFSFTAPTLNISTQLVVFQYIGRQIISDTAPSVTCSPSDTRAPVRWREVSLSYPNTPSELGLSFSPRNQTIVFPQVYESATPPSMTYTLVCDLVDPRLPNDREIAPQFVLVRFVQSKFGAFSKVHSYIQPNMIRTGMKSTCSKGLHIFEQWKLSACYSSLLVPS